MLRDDNEWSNVIYTFTEEKNETLSPLMSGSFGAFVFKMLTLKSSSENVGIGYVLKLFCDFCFSRMCLECPRNIASCIVGGAL